MIQPARGAGIGSIATNGHTATLQEPGNLALNLLRRQHRHSTSVIGHSKEHTLSRDNRYANPVDLRIQQIGTMSW
jgi:hypothetical protein